MTEASNRRKLHAHERRAAAALALAYGSHTAVTEWVRRVPPDAQHTDPNLTTAIFAFRAGLAGFGLTAQQIITAAQQTAAQMGTADAQQAVGDAQVGDGGDLSYDSADGTVNAITDDAPHRLAQALFARLGLGGLLPAAQAVIAATLSRVLLTNRQAIIDAYRTAMHDVFARTPAIQGWIWISQLSATTCGYCWAMHGTWHPADEVLGTHPFCQCVEQPSTLNAQQYAMTPTVVPGPAIFAELDGESQRQILGPARHALYRRGVPLSAMLGDRSLLPLYKLRRGA